MITFKLTKEDILNVATSIHQILTKKEIVWVLLCYEDAQRQDPSGTWNLVVEDLIYQIPRIRDDFHNPKFGEDASTDDTWFDADDDVNLNIGGLIQ
jgi:hypothetical protein